MTDKSFTSGPLGSGLSRRSLLKASAGLGVGVVAGAGLGLGGLSRHALAADAAKVGNWPVGVQGDSAFVGIGIPTTGPYSAQGEDLLKGYKLAIEHLNSGNALARSMAPASKPGILGKKVVFGVADTASKPDNAVQAHTRFINENKAMMITGSVSSAVAIASQKLAQREKVLYLAGISGSNETTGADCQRYGFRGCFYGYSASAAIAPVLAKELGKGRKVAYLTPDYTYGHTVFQSMQEFTGKHGWTTATNQLAPLGTTDFSSYILNMLASGADTLVNICFGADAVNSIKQAKEFGALKKMKMVVPYYTPFLAQQIGADIMDGIYIGTDFDWSLESKYPKAKQFVEAFDKAYGYKPEWGAHIGYLQIVLWAAACEQAGSFNPVDVIKAYEAEKEIDSTIGPVHWRAGDHQLVRPVYIMRGKGTKEMKDKADFFSLVDIADGKDVTAPLGTLGCKLGSYT